MEGDFFNQCPYRCGMNLNIFKETNRKPGSYHNLNAGFQNIFLWRFEERLTDMI